MQWMDKVWEFLEEQKPPDEDGGWFMLLIITVCLGGIAVAIICAVAAILIGVYKVLGIIARDYPHSTIIMVAIPVIWLVITYNGYKRRKKERRERQWTEIHSRQMDYDK